MCMKHVITSINGSGTLSINISMIQSYVVINFYNKTMDKNTKSPPIFSNLDKIYATSSIIISRTPEPCLFNLVTHRHIKYKQYVPGLSFCLNNKRFDQWTKRPGHAIENLMKNYNKYTLNWHFTHIQHIIYSDWECRLYIDDKKFDILLFKLPNFFLPRVNVQLIVESALPSVIK